MARRSRRPVSFGSASLLERLQAIVSEIRMTYTQATLESSDRIHGFRIRLNDALRNVERLSHLLGPCHANIVAGVEEILAMLRQLERRASERIGYLPGHRNTRKFPPVSASFKLCCSVIAVADLGGVRAVQMHPPLAASSVFLMHCSNINQAQF